MRTHLTLALSIACLSLVACSVAHAEIAPKYYAMSQKSAPEAITIQVESVEASVCWFNACDARDVTVTAKVTAVARSATGIKAGQTITITYQNRNMKGRSGPRPIRVLTQGETTPAFLRKAGQGYEPAARGASFQDLITP